ncbi:hypothetical protein [Metabacillus sp. SLBN-84]
MIGNVLEDATAQLRQLQKEAAEQIGDAQDAIMEQIESVQKTINREIERIRQRESLKRQMEAKVESELSELKSGLSAIDSYESYKAFLVQIQGRLVSELDGEAIQALHDKAVENHETAVGAEEEFQSLKESIAMANWVVRNVKGLY